MEKRGILFPNREHLPYLLPTLTEIRCITLLIWRHKSLTFSPLQGFYLDTGMQDTVNPPSPSHRPERRFRSCFGRRCGWKIWPKKAKLVPASFAPATNGDGFSGGVADSIKHMFYCSHCTAKHCLRQSAPTFCRGNRISFSERPVEHGY